MLETYAKFTLDLTSLDSSHTVFGFVKGSSIKQHRAQSPVHYRHHVDHFFFIRLHIMQALICKHLWNFEEFKSFLPNSLKC